MTETSKNEKIKFMRLNNGRITPSHFAGGSYDALKTKPISLRQPESAYNRLLRVLDKIRSYGEVWASEQKITTTYNSDYSANQSISAIVKRLSRFYTWGWVDYRENPRDRRRGYWALKADIDINDIEGLIARAASANYLNSNGAHEQAKSCKLPEPEATRRLFLQT